MCHPAARAAVLASRIIRNHPLPDGNKRVALLLMLDYIERTDFRWVDPPGGDVEIADTIEALAAREISEQDFTAWVAQRMVARHLRDAG